MKTKKFILMVEIQDCIVVYEHITEKMYNSILKKLEDAVTKTGIKDDEYSSYDKNVEKKEYEGYTETEIRYTIGCSFTILIKLECNKGYHFIK